MRGATPRRQATCGGVDFPAEWEEEQGEARERETSSKESR